MSAEAGQIRSMTDGSPAWGRWPYPCFLRLDFIPRSFPRRAPLQAWRENITAAFRYGWSAYRAGCTPSHYEIIRIIWLHNAQPHRDRYCRAVSSASYSASATAAKPSPCSAIVAGSNRNARKNEWSKRRRMYIDARCGYYRRSCRGRLYSVLCPASPACAGYMRSHPVRGSRTEFAACLARS